MGERKLCGDIYSGSQCVLGRFHVSDHEDAEGIRWRLSVDTETNIGSVEPENILQEADRLTSEAGKRPGDYGHPRDNLQLTADLWAPILGCRVTAEQVALCMVQLKIARECHKPGRDNLVDIAGWARTIERLEE